MIRALVERLPVMIAPRWVSVAAQPIAIADLISYLLAALDLPLDGNKIFEIGGSDQVSYGGLMKEYAAATRIKTSRDLGSIPNPAVIQPLAWPGHSPLRPGGPEADR